MIEVRYTDNKGTEQVRTFAPWQYAAWLSKCLDRLGRLPLHTAKSAI